MASRYGHAVPAGVAIPRVVLLKKKRKRKPLISTRALNRLQKHVDFLKRRRSRLKRTPIRRESKNHKAEMRKYRKLAATFLAQPENSWCICCTLRREKLQENIVRNPSVEIHHWAGRIGRLLCYVPYFRAFCNACRTWPHEHPSLARELNLLAPAKLWNVFPG